MGCCCAVGCSNRNTKGFRLFKLPKEKNRRLIWIRNIRRSKWTPTDRSELCEAHFEPSQFEQGRKDGWKKLKTNAIPTIFAYNEEERKKPQKKPPKDGEISPEQLHHSEPPEEHPSTSHVSLQNISHVTPSVLQSHNLILPELDVTAEANQSVTSDRACPNSSAKEKSASSPTSNASEGTAKILNTRQDQSSSTNETLSKESLEGQGSSELHTSVRTLACAFPDQGSTSTDLQRPPDTFSGQVGWLSCSTTFTPLLVYVQAEAASTSHATSHAEIAAGVNDRLSASETGANHSSIDDESVMTVGNSSNFTETAGNEVSRSEFNASTDPTNDSLITQEVHSKLLHRIQYLEHQNSLLRSREGAIKRKYERLQNGLKRIFNDDQIQALARESNRGCKWSEQTIEESLQLYLACGTKGYDLLCSKSLPLPSARSLRERIQGQQRPKDSKLHQSECS